MPDHIYNIGDIVAPDSPAPFEIIQGEVVSLGDGVCLKVRWLSSQRGAFTETEQVADIVLIRSRCTCDEGGSAGCPIHDPLEDPCPTSS